MSTLRSDTLLASSWPCHQCSHSNDSSRNKKRCSSCQAWRDGLAPLSAKAAVRRRREQLRPTSGSSTTTQPATTRRMARQTTRPLAGTGVQRRAGVGLRENLPIEDQAEYCVRQHRHRLRLYAQCVRSLPAHRQSVVASPTASLDRHLPLLQGQCSTLLINCSSGLRSPILEWRALLALYFRRCRVSACHTRAWCRVELEWFFGDARQMVGGSTNKLTAAGFDRADKKESTFNATKFSLVGNNSTGDNIFGRNKRF